MNTASSLLALTTIDGINAMLDATQAGRELARGGAAVTVPALAVGARVRIEKGCKAREVAKGATAKVTAIVPQGKEYGHNVKVTLLMLNGFKSGKSFTFYARHINRLNESFISMNDGDPTHKIDIRRA